MEDERLESETENEVTSQSEAPTTDTGSGSGNSKRLFIVGGIVVALLIAAGFFFFSSSSEESVDDIEPTTETAVSTTENSTAEEPALEVAATVPEIAGEVAVTTTDPVNVTSIAEIDLAAAGIDALPQDISLQSNVYAVDSNETAVSGQVAVNVPADANATLLDLYGWNGTSWEFVPSIYDEATQQRISKEHDLYQAIALGAPQAPEQITISSQWGRYRARRHGFSVFRSDCWLFDINRGGRFARRNPELTRWYN